MSTVHYTTSISEEKETDITIQNTNNLQWKMQRSTKRRKIYINSQQNYTAGKVLKKTYESTKNFVLLRTTVLKTTKEI